MNAKNEMNEMNEDPMNEDTHPLAAGPTATYPALPAAYARDDDARDDASSAGAVGTGSGATAVDAAGRTRRAPRPRVRTVVFGLVMLTISVLSLVALLTDVRVDGGVVGLGLLIGAGAALVAGGVAAAVREAKGGPGAVH